MKIQKAFKLSVNDLIVDEPWFYDNILVYAETHGEAKSKGIYEFECGKLFDPKGYNCERDVLFTDIRARRCKKEDKFLVSDRWRTREQMEQMSWELKRDDEAKRLWIDNPDGIAVVWAGCYGSYWGANHCGYTSDKTRAGKYSTKEAYEIVKDSDYSRQEKVILVNKEEYNLEINKKIKQLENSIL